VLVETTEANAQLGMISYCGTSVRDDHAIHYVEFHVVPRHNGRVEAPTVVLDGDHLILAVAFNARLERRRGR
jgi:hypothetical protein